MRPISRRTFLALSAGIVAASCSSTDGDATPDSVAATDSGGTETTPATTEGTPVTTTPTPEPTEAEPLTNEALATDPFGLGVASGDPTSDSVILWTRLLGDDLPDTVPVAYHLATDEDFADIVVSQVLDAVADDAHSIHADPTGLEPDRWYFFRFEAGGFTSPVGRTRTMPADDATPERMVIGNASCQAWQDGFYTAHADIAAAELDLLFWLGDYMYEGGPVEVGGSVVRAVTTPTPNDLAGYRARYAEYKSDPLLQASHASCPWVVTWDDHEVQNNYADLVSQDGATEEEFAARRAAAYRAWWEHQPVRLPKPADPSADFPIYRAVRFGSLADVSVLDTRQYRSPQACGDPTLSLDPACPETAEPNRTLMGEAQEAWLFGRLGQQGTVWNVLAQQVVMTDIRVGDAVLNYDQWDGYPAARGRLLSTVESAGAENLVVLTGDIHFAGVGKLRSPSGAIVGIEFVDTSISSSGDVPPELAPIVSSFEDVVDIELAHRGWTKHTITPIEWTAEFRIVDDALIAGGTSSTWKTFRLPAGSTDIAET